MQGIEKRYQTIDEIDFETITLLKGTTSFEADYTKTYRLKAKEVAFVRTYKAARSKNDRGEDKTLYLREDGTYVVYEYHWSRWANEVDEYKITKDLTIQDVYENYISLYNAINFEKYPFIEKVIEEL